MSYLRFDGPGTLQLEEGGKVYEPGERMPGSLSAIRRAQLQAGGLRFTTVHDEPVVTPEGTPAAMAAAEQIEPPMGGPVVVAAVEDTPKADDERPTTEQPAPRASRRDK